MCLTTKVALNCFSCNSTTYMSPLAPSVCGNVVFSLHLSGHFVSIMRLRLFTASNSIDHRFIILKEVHSHFPFSVFNVLYLSMTSSLLPSAMTCSVTLIRSFIGDNVARYVWWDFREMNQSALGDESRLNIRVFAFGSFCFK